MRLIINNFVVIRQLLKLDISKSGKHAPWVGYFWSGCAAATKKGLEILGVGLIDVDSKDCIRSTTSCVISKKQL